jgi:hypothetical protein
LKFLDDLLGDFCNDFHSILVIMVWTAEDRTGPSAHKTHNQSGAGWMSWLARMFLPVVNYASSYRRVYSAKAANPYMGWKALLTDPPKTRTFSLTLSHPSSCACLVTVGTHLTFWTTISLSLNFECLTLLATEPKLDIHKEELNLTRWRWIQCITSVWKKWSNRRDMGNIEEITWTILWSSEQNAVQIISLNVVNENLKCDRNEILKCDRNENVMKINERELSYRTSALIIHDVWTNNSGNNPKKYELNAAPTIWMKKKTNPQDIKLVW